MPADILLGNKVHPTLQTRIDYDLPERCYGVIAKVCQCGSNCGLVYIDWVDTDNDAIVVSNVESYSADYYLDKSYIKPKPHRLTTIFCLTPPASAV